MYAVIMAGGGGTRLHPLSRPERPKPFLPLLGDETLLQATDRRLRELTDDITVVTDRRYERLVRDQVPDGALLLEPMGRNTAAAIALATSAIDRPADEVMLVMPADAHIDPAREGVYQGVLGSAAEPPRDRRVRHRGPARHARHPGDRPATEYGYLLPSSRSARRSPGSTPTRCSAFEEKPKPARAEDLFERVPGAAWNAGMFLWRRRAIRAALLRYTGLVQSLEPMASAPQLLERAYEAIQQPLSIDHAVMEGAARNGQVVMAIDGRRLVGPRLVDRAAGRDRGARRGRRRPGRRDRPGRGRRPHRPPRRRPAGRHRATERGSMTAAQPIAVLRGSAADIDTVNALIERCAQAGG